MSRSPMIVRTVPALRRALDGLRARKATIALVPTMGALHDGHVSLVRLAKGRARKVIVSIFVNPTQFAPTEDFGSYPRTWKADVSRLAAEDVDLIWNPDVKVMYPEGFATRIVPEGPAVAGLEDRFRPHFFGGVATVVGKLFTQVRPDFAIFGEKDFQQLRVVAQMAGDLDLRVKVIGSRTVRERDGLAMSSRNVYLTPGERQVAPVLYRAMKESAKRLRAGDDVEAAMAGGRELITNAGFIVDYFEVRHAVTLAPIASVKDGPARILVAARLGKTRLIDNLGV
ncbi:MAG: pantoate--beta-alanine ligase [Bradyrhizobium sp.]|uniref:pantoate--beta-alanine ligase n=1 Tax=Bradyrhizobium sp. TaxID=376 RepID=UPI00272221ED|nr:pantoate--beta-alanine ligase [Bradyrhizobium sp.]MDO8401044.1 pantoate--beta-alanine ligase [Bradyrhizobium sp.]